MLYNRKFLWALVAILPVLIFNFAETDEEPAAALTDTPKPALVVAPLVDKSLDAEQRFASLGAIRNKEQSPQAPLDIQQWQTAKGAKVLFVAAPELPMVDVRLVFDAGSARDGAQAGLARLTASLLGEGSTHYNADQIAAGFEGLGAQFSAASYRDMGVTSLRSLTLPAQLEPALSLFGEVISQPTFPASDLKRIKEQMLSNLQFEKQQASKQASLALYAKLYGDHPYAQASNGNEESLKALEAADLKRFFERYYVARNAVIAIVGAVSQAQAASIAEDISTQLASGEHAPALPKVNALSQGEHIHIDHPSAQTSILISALGVKRGDPAQTALYVGNEILGGGGFGSRLMEEVREKRGLSYGIGSYFIPMREQGPFMISLKTRNDQAQTAEDVVQSTLATFLNEGPSADELLRAKQSILGSHAMNTASNSSIVGHLGSIGFYDQPLNHLQLFMQEVEALSLEDIQHAYTQVLKDQPLLIVTAGSTPETAE